MGSLKAIGAIFLFAFASTGSTCHGQSTGGEVVGDPDKASADKSQVTLIGVDTSALTPREKKEWGTYVSELLAPCADTLHNFGIGLAAFHQGGDDFMRVGRDLG